VGRVPLQVNFLFLKKVLKNLRLKNIGSGYKVRPKSVESAATPDPIIILIIIFNFSIQILIFFNLLKK
jgi:hypothetical protein